MSLNDPNRDVIEVNPTRYGKCVTCCWDKRSTLTCVRSFSKILLATSVVLTIYVLAFSIALATEGPVTLNQINRLVKSCIFEEIESEWWCDLAENITTYRGCQTKKIELCKNCSDQTTFSGSGVCCKQSECMLQIDDLISGSMDCPELLLRSFCSHDVKAADLIDVTLRENGKRRTRLVVLVASSATLLTVSLVAGCCCHFAGNCLVSAAATRRKICPAAQEEKQTSLPWNKATRAVCISNYLFKLGHETSAVQKSNPSEAAAVV